MSSVEIVLVNEENCFEKIVWQFDKQLKKLRKIIVVVR